MIGLVLLAASNPDVRAQQQEDKPTPLEFWHVGDDALSQSLAQEVYTALAAAPDFVPSTGKRQGSLLVEIPANVTTKQVGKRTRVTYTVKYSTATDHVLSTNNGSCPEKQLSVCATQIVKGARIAARKVK